MFQKKGLAVMAGCFAFSAVACAGGAASPNSATGSARTQQGPSTTLTIWYPWGGPDGSVFEDRVRQFEHIHPDIHINATMVAGAGVSNGKFSTAVASGTAPDLVLYWNLAQTAQYAAQGALTDITATAKAVGVSPLQYFPGLRQYMAYGGSLYGVPGNAASYAVLVYNKKLLRNAGINPDTFHPKTLQDIEKLAPKIDKIEVNGKVDRITFAPQLGGQFDNDNFFWAQEYDVNIFASDGKTVLFDKDPNFVKYVGWLKGFVNKYGSATIQRYNSGFSGDYLNSAGNPFYQGKIAFIVDGSWLYQYASKYMPKSDIGVMPLPPIKAGQRPLTYMDSDVFWVPKGSKHPQEAMEFAKFWAQPANYANAADRTGNIAGTPQGVKLMQISKNPDFKEVIDALTTGRSAHIPMTPDQQWTQIYNQAIYNILYKNANISNSLKQAGDQIRSLYK